MPDFPPAVAAHVDLHVDTHEAFLGRRHIPNLDALRGISILWVILHHVPALSAPWAGRGEALLQTLRENGRHGVSFFFVISGFLICTLFLREERTAGQISLLPFYGRRALRLMPLYYLVLLLYCALVLGIGVYSAENRALFEQKLPSYLLYYSNVVPNSTQGPFFFAWSLAVEEQFYLLFGLSMRFAPRRAVIAGCVALILVKVSLYAIHGPAAADASAALRIALSYQEPILLGVLLAFAMNTRTGFAFCRRWLAAPAALAAIGAAIAILMIAAPVLGRSSAHAEVVYVLMTLFVGGACLRPSLGGAPGRALDHMGKVSYGAYLLHMLVINSTRRITEQPAIVFAVSAGVTFALATVVYRFIEAPMLRLRHRLEPRTDRAASDRPFSAVVTGAPR